MMVACLSIGPLRAEDNVSIQKAEMEITSGQSQTFEVALANVPASKRAVLGVTAWVMAGKFNGYVGAMKVYWNDVELKKSERPAVLEFLDGRKQPSFVPTVGWIVPYINDPDQYADHTESPYFIQEEGLNPAVFAFELPDVFDGTQELRIESTLQSEKNVLNVKDVSITYQ
jgi:hypothetical protein